jgi:hypothetical protein
MGTQKKAGPFLAEVFRQEEVLELVLKYKPEAGCGGPHL